VQELERNRKRELRWAFCYALYHAREYGISELSLRAIANDMRSQLSDVEVREQIRYLEEIGYCRTEKLPTGDLFATRTAKLVRVVEYNEAADEGIARPDKKWW